MRVSVILCFEVLRQGHRLKRELFEKELDMPLVYPDMPISFSIREREILGKVRTVKFDFTLTKTTVYVDVDASDQSCDVLIDWLTDLRWGWNRIF